MDLNITMRYIMVQAQREADGGAVCVEHIYMWIISLCGKTVEEIARRPEHVEQVRADLEELNTLVSHKKIDVWPICYLLKETLAGHFPQENIPVPDQDVPGLISRSEKRAGEKGHENISVSDVLTEIENKPTPLISFCFIECGMDLTPQERAAARGMVAIRERLGYDPVSAADVTVADVGAPPPAAETILQTIEPKPQEKPAPKEEPVYMPEPPANVVVFFDIPAPGATPQPVAKQEHEEQPKATKLKRRIKIAGLNFRGALAIAAAQFFLLVLAVSVAILFGLARLADAEAVDLTWIDFAFGVVIFFAITMILKGITSLLGRRFKPLEIFMNTIIHLAFGLVIASLAIEKAGYIEEPVWAKLIIILFALILIIVSMRRLKILQKQADSNGHALSTAMLKLYGTPSSIFFEYILRSSLIPIIVFAIVWIGDLQINKSWHAAFSIYGFLLVYDAIRVLLQCWIIRYNKPNLHYKKKKWKKLSMFLLTEHLLLGLPVLGLFLMWYFNWFPMPLWVTVLYCAYGLLWFLVTAGALVTKVE